MLHMPSLLMASGAARAPVGQQLFARPYSGGTPIDNIPWLVPAGVRSICVVAIGMGCMRVFNEGEIGGLWPGAGGGLAYVNDIAVEAGETLRVTVSTTASEIRRSSSVLCRATAARVDDYFSPPIPGQATTGTGFSGGGSNYFGGGDPNGAGAGGYTSAGGHSTSTSGVGRGGGGSSPFGGGAGRPAGGSATTSGQDYGGGAGSGNPGAGCLRILWGPGRAFPNTQTGDIV